MGKHHGGSSDQSRSDTRRVKIMTGSEEHDVEMTAADYRKLIEAESTHKLKRSSRTPVIKV